MEVGLIRQWSEGRLVPASLISPVQPYRNYLVVWNFFQERVWKAFSLLSMTKVRKLAS
jgi:hypothetical protein